MDKARPTPPCLIVTTSSSVSSTMKLCAACSQELPKEKFSKKQWQAKQQRRCKDCIADNRELTSAEAPNYSTSSAADSEIIWTDEDLFKEPPPRDECPICFLPRPLDNAESQYQSCCGKRICIGCIYAHKKADNRCLCPFCRTPPTTSDREEIERLKERAGADDSNAIRLLGCYYRDGEYGLRQNRNKAVKLFLRSGELGNIAAYNSVGVAYDNGQGVERDENKAKYYYELAAMGGSITARHNLGACEKDAGNMDRAVKHWMIAAGAGCDKSLKAIRVCYLDGDATKDDFEKALRAHKEAKDEMKSEQREAAAAQYVRS